MANIINSPTMFGDWTLDPTIHGSCASVAAIVVAIIIFLLDHQPRRWATKKIQTVVIATTETAAGTDAQVICSANTQTEGRFVPRAAFENLQAVASLLERKVEGAMARAEELSYELDAAERAREAEEEQEEEEEEPVIWREEYDDLNDRLIEQESQNNQMEREIAGLRVKLAQQQLS